MPGWPKQTAEGSTQNAESSKSRRQKAVGRRQETILRRIMLVLLSAFCILLTAFLCFSCRLPPGFLRAVPAQLISSSLPRWACRSDCRFDREAHCRVRPSIGLATHQSPRADFSVSTKPHRLWCFFVQSAVVTPATAERSRARLVNAARAAGARRQSAQWEIFERPSVL